MGRRICCSLGVYVYDTHKKKLPVQKRQWALAILGGLLVGFSGISACTAAIDHMIATSNPAAEAARSSAP